jgi:hypothetical protein
MMVAAWMGGDNTGLLDQAGQVAAFDQFEHQIRVAVLLTGVEDGNDIRVIELADGTRFGQQQFLGFRAGQCQMERLDGDLALQLRVPAKIDDALGPATEFFLDFESTDLLWYHVGVRLEGFDGCCCGRACSGQPRRQLSKFGEGHKAWLWC